MVLYVILGIAAAIIIALTVVLSRRGAQMEGTDFASKQKGMSEAFQDRNSDGHF